MKVVIIDDHPLVRRGLADVLSLEESLDFSGEAKNVKEASALLEKVKPELALIDLRLGNESGLNVVRSVKATRSSCKFVLLTSSATKADLIEAKEAEVDGFIHKSALPEELLYAIKLVSQGRKYYDPSILELMMDEKKVEESERIVEQLTQKETEVLKLLGKGLANRHIAKELYITEYTVKKHVSQVLSKLQLDDRTQAALYANSRGLVKYEVS
ncbi:DNA-binding NarL/FixJ family response regulator [Bacillus tianshenii]|uniref:DNA-binding NarL/FixJ family response regulator n=1 Tax=Sutcliffiella tianshenii TaxID=1463404 RepID=A0ABS2NV84_9BACI|nr:response regulator transcription factor [Bacillus tianshenii]MBM7618559.1 DNA-binding NarL/FixJ family response regulator [Bacillus tianshenii]